MDTHVLGMFENQLKLNNHTPAFPWTDFTRDPTEEAAMLGRKGCQKIRIRILGFSLSFVVTYVSLLNKPAVSRLATGITLCSMDTDTPAPANSCITNLQLGSVSAIWGQPKILHFYAEMWAEML